MGRHGFSLSAPVEVKKMLIKRGGKVVIICERCGIQLESDDVYSTENEKLCEECMIKYRNPSKPCGGGPGGAQPN